MKRTLSKVKLTETLGPAIKGSEMSQFGLPNLNPHGIISDFYSQGCVERTLEVLDLFFPEIHIVTFLRSSNVLNRYEKENVAYYRLYRGDADPNLEFVFDEAAREASKETLKYIFEIMRGEHPEYFEFKSRLDMIKTYKRFP